MNKFNIKHKLTTFAAALTLSSFSLTSQAAFVEYSFTGLVTANPGSAFVNVTGGSFTAFFLAEDIGGDGVLNANSTSLSVGDFNEAAGFPLPNGTPHPFRTATRFVIRNAVGQPSFPGVESGHVSSSSLSVDALGNITGGAIDLSATTPNGGSTGNISIDAAGTWSLELSGLNIASGQGQFAEIAAVPVPAAAWLFSSALIGLVCSSRKRG